LAADLKRAEAASSAEQTAVKVDRKALADEITELKASLGRLSNERATLVGSITPNVLAIFDLVSRRRQGVAVAQARNGICTICHVRMRPQVFNTVRRNDEIVQCDSCQRILYFEPTPAPVADSGNKVDSAAR
jgi:predicted  nucleic acid-binding Zn-ribbon protein